MISVRRHHTATTTKVGTINYSYQKKCYISYHQSPTLTRNSCRAAKRRIAYLNEILSIDGDYQHVRRCVVRADVAELECSTITKE